jgi:hypothetical protein
MFEECLDLIVLGLGIMRALRDLQLFSKPSSFQTRPVRPRMLLA